MGVLPPQVDAQLLSDRLALSAAWAWGRVYYNALGARWDAVISTPVPKPLPAPTLVGLIQQLLAAVGPLQAGRPPPPLPDAPRPAVLLQHIRAVLGPLIVGGDPLRLVARVPTARAAAQVEIFIQGGLFRAVAWPEPPRTAPPSGETMLILNHLNGTLVLASVGYSHPSSECHAMVAVPWSTLAEAPHQAGLIVRTAAATTEELPGTPQ